MSISESKKKILTSSGYEYHHSRMIYFNRETKKIFSNEAIMDHDEKWLKTSIKEPNHSSWQFYFNFPQPSEELKIEITSEIK